MVGKGVKDPGEEVRRGKSYKDERVVQEGAWGGGGTRMIDTPPIQIHRQITVTELLHELANKKMNGRRKAKQYRLMCDGRSENAKENEETMRRKKT